MPNERNPDNKSIHDLEKEKLQVEVEILKVQLAKDLPDVKPKKWFDKLADFARKWSALMLGTVTLISAIFGVFIPLSEYLDERRNALKYNLNENMIGFVDDMMSDDDETANRGIMMLSYYEINSIPILLYFLSRSESEESTKKIIENIHWIHFDNSNNTIVEMVMGRMQFNFEKLKVTTEEGELRIDEEGQTAVQNYIDLIKVLQFTSNECRIITSNFNTILKKMDEDGFYNTNTDAKGVKNKLKRFLTNNDSCN